MTAHRHEISGPKLWVGRVLVVVFVVPAVLVLTPILVVAALVLDGWRWLTTPEQPEWDK